MVIVHWWTGHVMPSVELFPICVLFNIIIFIISLKIVRIWWQSTCPNHNVCPPLFDVKTVGSEDRLTNECKGFERKHLWPY